MSQVLSFVCSFVYFFVWICFQVRESSTEGPEESRDAGSERDRVVYIFLLNNIARWTFTLLIVLEVFCFFSLIFLMILGLFLSSCTYFAFTFLVAV